MLARWWIDVILDYVQYEFEWTFSIKSHEKVCDRLSRKLDRTLVLTKLIDNLGEYWISQELERLFIKIVATLMNLIGEILYLTSLSSNIDSEKSR